MTDIIARAKELADNGHPPRPWKVDYGPYLGADVDILDRDGEFICGIEGYTDVDGGEIADREIGDMLAFAPDAIAALAEETWEYGVQSRELDPIDGWFPWTMTIPFHKGRSHRSCLRFIEGRSGHNFEYRIVRRRVSPTEVVE